MADIFVRIDGIDGESQDAAHRGAIQASSVRWKISQDSSMHSGSGGGAGKATVGDMVLTHDIDRASPNLMKYNLTGKHIGKVVVTLRKAGGAPLEFLRYTLEDVIVTGVEITIVGENFVETVGLSFARVKQEYTVQNAQGGNAGTVTASFDIRKNAEI
jgi:type VI secretion system secreted protein Hcp